jgi:putative ABC transport system permease protein
VITNLFPGQDPIGASINVNGVLFRVIGTLQSAGSGAGGGGFQDQDNIMIAPITAVEQHLVSERTVTGAIPLDQLYVQASSTDAVDSIVSDLTQVLRVQHNIKPGAVDDFNVTAQLDVLNNFNSLISTLTIFLGVIGGVSLVVGGIGVMNIMLVTVTERTREIGLRKAVGARDTDVLMQFLTESLVLCFVGAASGLALAVGATTLVRSLVPTLPTYVSLPSVVLAAGVTSLIGVFFGLYPASRAAALSPIQALRSE